MSQVVQLCWPLAQRSGPFVPLLDGPHRLWRYKGRKPQWAHSIIIRTDGSVQQAPGMTLTTITAPDVHLWIGGGTDFRTEVGSFEHRALTAAGFTFRTLAEGYGVMGYGSPPDTLDSYGSPATDEVCP